MLWDDNLGDRIQEVREAYYEAMQGSDSTSSPADTDDGSLLDLSSISMGEHEYRFSVILLIITIPVVAGIYTLGSFSNPGVAFIVGIAGLSMVALGRTRGITIAYVIGALLLLNPIYLLLVIAGLGINVILFVIGVGAALLASIQPKTLPRNDIKYKLFNAASISLLPIWLIAVINILLSFLAGRVFNLNFVIVVVLGLGTTLFLFEHDNLQYALARYIGTVSFIFSLLYLAEGGSDEMSISDYLIVIILFFWGLTITFVVGLNSFAGIITGTIPRLSGFIAVIPPPEGKLFAFFIAFGGPWALYVLERAIFHRINDTTREEWFEVNS